MCRSSVLVVGLIGLVGLTFGCGGQLRQFSTDATVLQGRPGPVRVTVLCPDVDSVSISVAPLSVGVHLRGDVTWQLVGGPNTRGFEITSTTRSGIFGAKRHWPFSGQPHASDGGRATARNARGKVGNRYPYKVTAQCQVPDGPLVEISIDPDVIITL